MFKTTVCKEFWFSINCLSVKKVVDLTVWKIQRFFRIILKKISLQLLKIKLRIFSETKIVGNSFFIRIEVYILRSKCKNKSFYDDEFLVKIIKNYLIEYEKISINYRYLKQKLKNLSNFFFLNKIKKQSTNWSSFFKSSTPC